MLLKLYLYGYLNRVPSSRRLEREAQRNVELMWLVGRLAPDHKTIALFRRDNGLAIQAACRQFVVLCRQLGLLAGAVAAIDGSKFKAVNNRDRNFTVVKVGKRIEQVDASIARYLAALDRADKEPNDVPEARVQRIGEKIAGLRRQMAFPAPDAERGRGVGWRPGLADRPGRALNGNQRARHRHRGLQRSDRGGSGASSRRRA